VGPVIPEHLGAVLTKLEEAGCTMRPDGTNLHISATEVRALDLRTMPFPGFPTDLQAPFMSLLATATGTSLVVETIFENRLQHVAELQRMGASIRLQGNTACIEGVARLSGAPVHGTDLRASAAMVLASYGAGTNPGELNKFLKQNGGFTKGGWLYWEKAAEFPPGVAEHIYEADGSHFLIDWNLLRGNPVIVRLRYPNGITHFVVIVGKQGYEYLIRDPGAGYAKGIYFLSDFGSPIEALRFYEKLPEEQA
jgi:hypothetical protein